MKKVFAIAAIVFLTAFSTQDKEYTVKFSEEQVNFIWQSLNGIKKYVDASNLPNQEVKSIIGSIDSIQRIMAPQIIAQQEKK